MAYIALGGMLCHPLVYAFGLGVRYIISLHFVFFSVDNLSVLSSSSLLYWLQRMTSLMIAGVMLVVMAMMGLPSVRALQCYSCDSKFCTDSHPGTTYCTGTACITLKLTILGECSLNLFLQIMLTKNDRLVKSTRNKHQV